MRLPLMEYRREFCRFMDRLDIEGYRLFFSEGFTIIKMVIT